MTCVVLSTLSTLPLYKNSSNWRTQEDAIASDLLNNLKGSGIIYLFNCLFTYKISRSKKLGHDDQNVKNRLDGANVIQNLITSFDSRALMRP